MRVIEGGVTAAKGYKAAGLRAGIKAGKTNKDMAMIYSEKEAVCAGTFTKNVVKAAPVFWDRDVVYKEGKAQARCRKQWNCECVYRRRRACEL